MTNRQNKQIEIQAPSLIPNSTKDVIEGVKSEIKVLSQEKNLTHLEGENIRANEWDYHEHVNS